MSVKCLARASNFQSAFALGLSTRSISTQYKTKMADAAADVTPKLAAMDMDSKEAPVTDVESNTRGIPAAEFIVRTIFILLFIRVFECNSAAAHDCGDSNMA